MQTIFQLGTEFDQKVINQALGKGSWLFALKLSQTSKCKTIAYIDQKAGVAKHCACLFASNAVDAAGSGCSIDWVKFYFSCSFDVNPIPIERPDLEAIAARSRLLVYPGYESDLETFLASEYWQENKFKDLLNRRK